MTWLNTVCWNTSVHVNILIETTVAMTPPNNSDYVLACQKL